MLLVRKTEKNKWRVGASRTERKKKGRERKRKKKKKRGQPNQNNNSKVKTGHEKKQGIFGTS
jgi:hypothetical protein